MTPRIRRTFGGFYHRAPPLLVGIQPQRNTEGRWEYPPLETTMAASCLEEAKTYVLRRQRTITQYIATHPILELYMEAERRPGVWVSLRWWDQEVLDLEGVRLASQATDAEVEVEMADQREYAETGNDMEELSRWVNVALK